MGSLKSLQINCHINNPRDYPSVAGGLRSLILGLPEGLARDVDRSYGAICHLEINLNYMIKRYKKNGNKSWVIMIVLVPSSTYCCKEKLALYFKSFNIRIFFLTRTVQPKIYNFVSTNYRKSEVYYILLELSY